MPVYEYYCPQCDYKFEKLRPICGAEEEVACNLCNQPSKRILSRFASYSKNSGGETTAIAGTSNSCAGCSSASCNTCH